MKKHEEKFDAITELLLQQGISRKSCIRSGREGTGEELFTDQQQKLFESEIRKQFGDEIVMEEMNSGVRSLDLKTIEHQ
jgi:hypothetical protein